MTYNEFTAKKIGEVLAFCRVGIETIDHGKGALEQAFGGEAHVSRIRAGLSDHAAQLASVGKDQETASITFEKADRTGSKLKEMRDTYIGDEWDNPAELLEWLGFFEGAAIIHWALVLGVAEKQKDPSLKEIARAGIGFHRDLLNQVKRAIVRIGSERSS